MNNFSSNIFPFTTWMHVMLSAQSLGLNALNLRISFVIVFAGMSKGVGFIRFDTRAEAEKAIEKLNGVIPDGASERIQVKFANNPSSNKSTCPITMFPYFPTTAQRGRLLGPIHHPTGRFR
jgi:RNA recognition motif-containing protein